MIKHKKALIIILLGFLISIYLSVHNIKNHDKNVVDTDGNIYHKMIKFDAYRYLSHGDEIKNQLKQGVNFFKTGREHYTKYLPARIMAFYYYFFDINLFENKEDKNIKKIKLNIHLNYLIIQCLFYFFCITIFYLSLSKLLNENITLSIIAFLSLEPTINQYHSTFWSESIFFSIQILLMSLILKKDSSILNFGLIGIFLAILSLQKEYAIFYIFFISIYFIFTKEKKIIAKLSVIFLFFFLIQSILVLNNYFRSGKFYIMTADSKVNIFNDMVTHVMAKTLNIPHRKFIEKEGEVVIKWLDDNSIQIDQKKLDKKLEINNYDAPSWIDFREFLNEQNKVKFDIFIRDRTIKFLMDYPEEFIKRVIKNSAHIALLNPFHIYSDHNFRSGEIYYFSQKQDELVKYRLIYSLIIYSVCLIGLFNIMKKKEYKLLFFLVVSIFYFYSLVSWQGNTRYFVPAFLYASIFFGFGLDKILNLIKQKKIKT